MKHKECNTYMERLFNAFFSEVYSEWLAGKFLRASLSAQL